MDIDEWDQWFKRHRQVLPAVEHWFSTMGQEGQIEVMRTWHGAMSDLSLDEATAATDAIVRGDAECRFPSDTPKVCRLTALGARQTRRKTEYDSDVGSRFCALCGGSGTVTVWHPLVVRSVRKKDAGRYRHPFTGKQIIVRDSEGNIKSMTGASACKCSRGDVIAQKFPRSDVIIPVKSREREDIRGLTLEEVIELDIAGSVFPVPDAVQEWEYV